MTPLTAGPHLLAHDFGWGHLQHHDQDCDECGGTGEVDDEECYECDGEGSRRWGSFYTQDVGECETCHREEVPIAEMYEDAWVCLPCYVAHHRKACGCDAWAEAERAMGVRDREEGGR